MLMHLIKKPTGVEPTDNGLKDRPLYSGQFGVMVRPHIPEIW
jgi:hypothetical protein